jgi:uncharacterized protein (DUF1330 family)
LEKRLSAYIIVCLDVTDPAAYAEYAREVPAVIAAHGGRYLARGGTAELLEGDAPVSRVVIVEFPDIEAARKWYYSPEYTRLREVRLGAAHGPFIVTEGLAA